VDSLATIGSPISSEDHIDAILDGLLEEYDSFITSITSWLDPYMVHDVESLLLAQEDRFDKHKFLDSSSAQANLTSTNWVPSSTSKHSSRGGRVPFRPPYNSKRQNFSRPPQPNSWRASVPVSNKYQRVQCHCVSSLGTLP